MGARALTENRPADPDRVLALRGRDDLDLRARESAPRRHQHSVRTRLHAAGAEARELLLHAVRDPRVHRRAAGEHDVPVQVAPDVEVALEDRVVPVRGQRARQTRAMRRYSRRLVDAGRLEAEEGWLEERLGRTESDAAA